MCVPRAIDCNSFVKLVREFVSISETSEESPLMKLYQKRASLTEKEWLKFKLETYYSDGIRKVVDLWTKCIR
jgi:hypothetical protein